MLPIRTERSKNLVEQEGRIELAISATNKGQILSIRKAAESFNVPYTTLQNKLRGRVARDDIRTNGHNLTTNEEEKLIE